jgi:hypothetical protein
VCLYGRNLRREKQKHKTNELENDKKNEAYHEWWLGFFGLRNIGLFLGRRVGRLKRFNPEKRGMFMD